MSSPSNEHFSHQVKKMIRFGLSKEQIFHKLQLEHCPQAISANLLKVVVDQTCVEYPDYELIQTVVRSKLAVDRDSDSSKIYAVDYLNRTIIELDKVRLNKMFDAKYDFRDRIYTCKFEYMPLNMKILLKEDGLWKFNTYVPPFWQTETFYTEGAVKVPKVSKVPELYHKFLTHLVDGDKESYNYVLDWVATAIQNRNYCILTTIGSQGIGKGVLGVILSKLVGMNNYAQTDKKLVRKDFNGQIYGKRIVYIDEVKINNSDEENKLKALINDDIEIEMKGKDAVLTKNYASIYMSSNQLNSLRLTADDRRFSIVNLTSKKLYESLNLTEIESLTTAENIAEFAGYLMYRKVDARRMLQVFKSERTEEVRLNQLNSWQEWFIEEYCFEHAGEKVSMREASEAIMNEFGPASKCGRRAFRALAEIYPDSFKVTSPKETRVVNGRKVRKTNWCLEIADHTLEDGNE